MDAGPKPWGWASLMHLVYPHNILHNHCFEFLLGITVVPIEIENNGHAIFFFGGGGEPRCVMVYVKMVNKMKVYIYY